MTDKQKKTGLWVALATALLLAIGGIIWWKRKKDAEQPITAGNGSDGSPDTGINPIGGGGSSYTPPPDQNPVQNGGNSGTQSTNTGGVVVGSSGGPDTGINTGSTGGGISNTGGSYSTNPNLSTPITHGAGATGAANHPVTQNAAGGFGAVHP